MTPCTSISRPLRTVFSVNGFSLLRQPRFPAAPELYGLFFEDINHAADGGLYPERLRNRAFEDSLPPEECETDPEQLIYINDGKWPGVFNHGEGMDEWAALRAITIDAARICRVDQRLGSLNPGKDADLAIFDGNPLELKTRLLFTVINGEIVWQN